MTTRVERLRENALYAAQRAGPVVVMEYDRPWVYPKQEQFLFNEARYSIVEASTKTGKTTGCLIWLVEQACLLGAPNRNFWWVAPIYGQSEIAYNRFKNYTRHLADLIKYNDSRLRARLPNGAVLSFKSGSEPDSLYGEDVYAVVLDEATRMRQESWFAIRSTMTATRGPVRIIGNVKGSKNWAYQLARRAEAGERGYYYAKLTAYDAVDAGILDLEEVEDAKRTLPVDVFNELYLAIPTEDGANPFGIGAIDRCRIALSTEKPVVWGWDLARSVDHTVGIGLDKHGKMCRFERWQRPWPDTIANIRALVGRTHALLDSTGVGDPVTQQLQRDLPDVEGYLFTSSSKQNLMQALAVAIQQQEIGIVDDPIILNELKSFEYEVSRTSVRYSAPEGLHDDCVCALALAWMAYDRRMRNAPVGRMSHFQPF